MTRTELAHRHGRPQGPAVRGLRSRARGAAGMICEHCGARPAMRGQIICRHCRDTIFFPREVLPG